MNLLKDKLSKIYFIFLASAIGSTIVSTIYVTVDMICVGHGVGLLGSAAISCVNPLWPLMIGPGVLCGVGGAVMMGNRRGAGCEKEADEYFTIGTFIALIFATIIGFVYILTPEPLLKFFGAEGEVLELATEYMKSIAIVAPTFTMCACLAAYMRGDGEAVVPTVATIAGGVVNIILDFTFVFGFNWGIGGAGLATSLGQMVAFVIIGGYFFTKKCRLRMAKPTHLGKKIIKIFSVGMAAYIVEMSFGITVTVYNKTINSHLGNTELAVFGVIATVMSMFYCIFNGIGTALQPIAAANHGAGQEDRVKKALELSFYSAIICGLIFFAITEFAPDILIKIHMATNEEELQVGIRIVRIYTCALPIVGISVVCTYYFQSILNRGMSLCISLMRGMIGPIVFVLLIPLAFGYDAIWWSIPAAEAVTVVMSLIFMLITKHRSKKETQEEVLMEDND